jgi:hypothetical protein
MSLPTINAKGEAIFLLHELQEDNIKQLGGQFLALQSIERSKKLAPTPPVGAQLAADNSVPGKAGIRRGLASKKNVGTFGKF